MNSMNVWDVCKFSDEIVTGNLNMSKFAVELHSVLDGSADEIYTDPQLFLENTYLTSNAKLMLRDALTRIRFWKRSTCICHRYRIRWWQDSI